MNNSIDGVSVASTWQPGTAVQTELVDEAVVSTTITMSDQEYITLWDQWQREPHYPSIESRAVAVERLKTCLAYKSETLHLGSLSLSTLPELPPHIKTLELSWNALTVLPDLPTSLVMLSIGNNQLLALPPLRSPLEFIDVCHNRLTALPVLPSSLKKLFANNNAITKLPVLPRYLEVMIANQNQLTELPDFSWWLSYVVASNNPLAVLPTRIPCFMRELSVTHNRISALPSYLFYLNQHSFSRFSIDVSENPLSLKTLSILGKNENDPHYKGPMIRFIDDDDCEPMDKSYWPWPVEHWCRL